MTELLKVDGIRCQFNSTVVIEQASFRIDSGEIACLLGPSGCGKTTLLRAIAGFQDIAAGSISLLGETIANSNGSTPPELRPVGMVFQDFALFPHLNVADNIRFGIHHLAKQEQQAIVDEMLELVQLDELGKRFPHELSGGQNQRVALARALARNPRLMLMDEPFSSLDAELRQSLGLEVREILKQRDISALLVTHDQEEAFAFADTIGLMKDGAIQQWASAYTLYHEPANRFVADFIGRGRFIPGFVQDAQHADTELGLLKGQLDQAWPSGSAVEILVRPDDLRIDPQANVRGTVVSKVFSGSATLYTLKLKTGSVVEALLPSHQDYDVGSEVGIGNDIQHLIAFQA